MAVTFDQLVSRVKQQLLGYTRDQASITFITEPMLASDAIFQVDTDTITNISRGLVEIDDELILVKEFDRSTGTVTVMAGTNGRGVEGTVAATHADNSIVTDDPMYPRTRIKEAINDTINATYPDLWTLGSYEFAWTAARYEYPVPTDVEDILNVTTNTIGPSAVWFPNSSWRFNPLASTTVGQVKPTPTPTGKSIQVMRDFIVPGRNVRINYLKKPAVLVDGDDDFEETTGYPERYVDLITYGTMWRLLPAYEAARLQQQAIEATERAPLVPVGAGSNASKYYMALYQQRLEEERQRLQRLYESFVTYNG